MLKGLSPFAFKFLLPRPAERSKGFLRVPGCRRAVTEELTPKADTPHVSDTRSRHLFVKACEAAAAFERLLSSTKHFAWHQSDCQRLRGDRQQGSAEASGGIWNWHIPQQSSTQLSVKSSTTTGMHHRRGPALTAETWDAPTVPLESAFSWIKHELHAKYLNFKGPDALGRDLNFKQIWISPAA